MFQIYNCEIISANINKHKKNMQSHRMNFGLAPFKSKDLFDNEIENTRVEMRIFQIIN